MKGDKECIHEGHTRTCEEVNMIPDKHKTNLDLVSPKGAYKSPPVQVVENKNFPYDVKGASTHPPDNSVRQSVYVSPEVTVDLKEYPWGAQRKRELQ